jgi:peroxin-7
VLTIDWNKYLPRTLVSAGVDKSVKVWDCRMIKPMSHSPSDEVGTGGAVGAICTHEMRGHEYAVRKVQWSPHRPDMLASAGYDMSCRMCVFPCIS